MVFVRIFLLVLFLFRISIFVFVGLMCLVIVSVFRKVGFLFMMCLKFILEGVGLFVGVCKFSSVLMVFSSVLLF